MQHSCFLLIAIFVRGRFAQKPGIYGSERVWTNARDVFRSTPSRNGHGRRAAVDFVVCFGWGGFFRVFFFKRTRPAASMRPPCLVYLSTSNEARPRERSDQGRFLPIGQKRLFIPGCIQGSIIQLVCVSVSVLIVLTLTHGYNAVSVVTGQAPITLERKNVYYCVCMTFVVFTNYETCTRPIHETGIYGSGRAWTNAWDVFRRTPSRGGHGRRAAVDLEVCFR